MGYFIPFRPFAVIAWLLLLAAAAGMVLRQPDGAVLAGIAAALASPALAARGVRRTG
jgi:predicted transcriptional regulator